MKKHITLLAGLFLFSGVYAQVTKINAPAMSAKKMLLLEKDAKFIKSESIEEKAEGDIIWSNNFSSPANWEASHIGGSNDPENGWKIGSEATWFFDAAPYLPTFTGGAPYAVCKNGDPQPGGSGVIPGATYILTYDSIFDLSGYLDVNFKFQQYGARFIERQTLEISKDGGATWLEAGSNDDLASTVQGSTNLYPNPQTRVFNVTQAVGPLTSTVKFRFKVSWPSNAGANSGIMYGWFVDNVQFVEGTSNDLKLNEVYAVVGTQEVQYSKLPTSQVSAATQIKFSGFVTNMGSNSQDVVLTVTGPSSFSTATTATPLAGFATDSLFTPGSFQIPSTTGANNFTYTITSDNNVLTNTGDDSESYSLEVTDFNFAVDRFTNAASTNGAFWGWATQSGDPAIGTALEIFNAVEISAMQIGIPNVTGSTQAEILGNQFFGTIHRLNPVTEQFEYVEQTPALDLAVGHLGQLVTVPFSNTVLLTPGLYMITAGSFNNAEVPIAFSGYVPTGQTMGWDGTQAVTLMGADEYENLVEAPVVRLVEHDPSTANIQESTVVSGLEVYPNPFAGTTEVKVSLKGDATVSAIVTDLSGRTVATVPAANLVAGANTISIDGTNFQAGVYNVVLTVGAEKITKRIIKN